MVDNRDNSQIRGINVMQQKANDTGLPDNLKSGVENLSGFSMNDVRVHYNSDKPVQIQAHAYTQGTDIHVAPGQEKHLPHETWHAVQQMQGRVQPTVQMQAFLDVKDPVKGTGTAGNVHQDLMASLPPQLNGAVQYKGHLLNHDLGGYAVSSKEYNLGYRFPHNH